MKFAEFFGALILVTLFIYVGWVLAAQDSIERVVRGCEPVYFVSKPIASLSKLYSDSASQKVASFFFAREKDCRFVVYDMVYGGEKSIKKAAN